MKNKWAIILGISLVTVTGCAQNQQSQPQQQDEIAASGPEQVYQQNCASCHGGNLEGGYAPSLQKIGKKYGQKEISNIIQNGKGNMPSFSNIPEGERKKLSQWLSEKK